MGFITVLAGFTVASLEEDAYGVLQKDIPKILEALTSYLIMLEKYTRELQASAAAGDVEHKVQVEQGLTSVVEPLVGGGFERPGVDEQLLKKKDLFFPELNSAIKAVLATFGERLNVFRMPTHVAARLQLIAEYMGTAPNA